MHKSVAAVALFTLACCGGWMLSGLDAPGGSWQTRYDDARLLQCLSLLLILGTILLQPQDMIARLRSFPLWIGLGVPVALLLGLLSASRSDLPVYAAIEVAFTAGLLIAALTLVGSSTRHPRFTAIALLIVAAGALVMGLRFAAEYTAAVVTGEASELEYSWMAFTNPRYFAKAATFALPLLWLAPALTQRRNRLLQLGCTAACLMIWSQLLGSGSRGALLGMVVGALIAVGCFGHTGRAYALYQTALATAGMLLWSFFVWAYAITAPGRIVSTGLSGRGDLYSAALTDIQGAPLLGIGPMHYSELGRHAATHVAGTHNFPLQLAAEWGLPAAALLLATLLAYCWKLFTLTRQTSSIGEPDRQNRIRVALFCAIAAAVVHSMFANVANEPISQTLAILLAALFPYTAPAATSTSTISRRAWLLTACALTAVAAGLLLAVDKGRHCVGEPDRNEYVAGIGGSIYPRLWSQGLIPLERSCRQRPPQPP